MEESNSAVGRVLLRCVSKSLVTLTLQCIPNHFGDSECRSRLLAGMTPAWGLVRQHVWTMEKDACGVSTRTGARDGTSYCRRE